MFFLLSPHHQPVPGGHPATPALARLRSGQWSLHRPSLVPPSCLAASAGVSRASSSTTPGAPGASARPPPGLPGPCWVGVGFREREVSKQAPPSLLRGSSPGLSSGGGTAALQDGSHVPPPSPPAPEAPAPLEAGTQHCEGCRCSIGDGPQKRSQGSCWAAQSLGLVEKGVLIGRANAKGGEQCGMLWGWSWQGAQTPGVRHLRTRGGAGGG